jgi:hypothetical protein
MISAQQEPGSRSSLFLFVFTNRAFIGSVAIVWTVLSIWISIHTNSWTWFGRSGSVLGILGGVLSCRSVLRLTREERERFRNMNAVECFTTTELADQERDSNAMIMGVVLLIVGTLIWAYGDLIPPVR